VIGNRLSVSGKREPEQVAESDTFYASERSYGSFTRTFTLPEGANLDQVRADLKDGVLTLQVPKNAEVQPRRAPIKSAKNGGEKQLKA
jgi:HSP20 family protein